MLDEQFVLALCDVIFEDVDDPESVALLAVLETTPVPIEELSELAQQFEAVGSDPQHALYLARLVKNREDLPDIVQRLDELAATRVPEPRITHLRARLAEHIHDQQPEAFDFLVAELRSRRDVSPHGDAELGPLLDALATLDDTWINTAIDLLPTEPTLWEPVESHLRAHASKRRIIDRHGIQCLVDAWLLRTEGPDGTRPDECWWASSLVGDVERWADESLHREILLQFVETAADERIWEMAAGPLEDFLTDNDDRLSWMEQTAAQNPRFRFALSGVWTYGKAPATAARIERAADDDA
ncbi:MAG: DUF6869 domain-containing protein [Ilumatobacteraceae bacterium]